MKPPRLLLLLWFAAVFAGGLRSDAAWLAWSAAFWLLVMASPPDGPAAARMNLWWSWLGWVLLSSLLSLEPLASLHMLWRKATVVLFFTLAWAWWGPKQRLGWVAGLWVVGAALAAGLRWGPARGFPAGLLPPNPNYTACFLAAAAASAFWAAGRTDQSRVARLGAAALFAAFAAAVVLTRSRGAMLGLGGSIALWSVWSRSWKVPLAALAAALALASLAPSERLYGWLKLDDPLAYERPRLWATAVDIAQADPWLGVGPGCFERGYFRRRTPVETGWTRFSRFTAHAHSEPLQLAAETGWLGLGFLLWALSFFTPSPRPAGFVSTAAAGAFWAVALHALVDGVLALPAVELLFFSSLACASDAAVPAFRYGPPRWRWLGPAGLALAGLTWLPIRDARRHAERAGFPVAPSKAGTAGLPPRQAAERLETGERERRLKAALAVHPADTYLRDRLAIVYLTEPPPRPALALWHLDEAISGNPSNAVFWAQKAELLFRIGDPEASLPAAAKAAELEPNFAAAHLLLAEAELSRGDRSAARERLGRAEAVRKGLGGVSPASAYEAALLHWPAERAARLAAALAK